MSKTQVLTGLLPFRAAPVGLSGVTTSWLPHMGIALSLCLNLLLEERQSQGIRINSVSPFLALTISIKSLSPSAITS